MNELQMIDVLVNQDWNKVQATNVYESSEKRFFLHIIFETRKGTVILVGDAHPDKEGYDNSFSLKILESQNAEKSSFEITNLSQQWKSIPFKALMKSPRDVTFRHDPLIHVREFPCKTFLDHFVSMELSKKTDDGKIIKLTLTASEEAPCCVEFNVSYG